MYRSQDKPTAGYLQRIWPLVTSVYLALVAGVLAYGLVAEEAFTLFSVMACLSPAGLVLVLGYPVVVRRLVKRKAADLADVFDDAADRLLTTEPDLPYYDTSLTTKTAFVWRGAISGGLIATARLMHQAKSMLVSEESRRDNEWLHGPTRGSPLGQVADLTHKVAKSLRRDDAVGILEAIGDILLLSLRHREMAPTETRGFSSEEFVDACSRIAGLLERREYIEAGRELDRLLLLLRYRPLGDPSLTRWQALVAYWLDVRMTILETAVPPWPIFLWVGPSRLLAHQLQAAILAYAGCDFVSLSEIINESFDFRIRIPRLILA